ncbi:hypothetical protein AaE_007150, partial [Aphanomyces astaci]
MSDDEERREPTGEPPVDDSVPLAFLLGHRYNYYAEAHRPVHAATAVEDRPRTPTDFRDMSKREREVRAKMVLDPLSHKAETFLTGVDTGQEFQSTSTRRQLKQDRLKQQRMNASLHQGPPPADLASLDTSHGFHRPRDFLAVHARPVPMLHDKYEAAKVEVHKVRLKQHWHLQYAQHIHSIAKDQQEFAQHMLAALKGRHPNRKMYMDEKRVAMERKKKTTAQDEEVLRMKQQKDAAALRDLKDEIAMRNLAAKHKKVREERYRFEA